jgi:hypothetical protein
MLEIGQCLINVREINVNGILTILPTSHSIPVAVIRICAMDIENSSAIFDFSSLLFL